MEAAGVNIQAARMIANLRIYPLFSRRKKHMHSAKAAVPVVFIGEIWEDLRPADGDNGTVWAQSMWPNFVDATAI
jgi:hypothetical protein